MTSPLHSYILGINVVKRTWHIYARLLRYWAPYTLFTHPRFASMISSIKIYWYAPSSKGGIYSKVKPVIRSGISFAKWTQASTYKVGTRLGLPCYAESINFCLYVHRLRGGIKSYNCSVSYSHTSLKLYQLGIGQGAFSFWPIFKYSSLSNSAHRPSQLLRCHEIVLDYFAWWVRVLLFPHIFLYGAVVSFNLYFWQTWTRPGFRERLILLHQPQLDDSFWDRFARSFCFSWPHSFSCAYEFDPANNGYRFSDFFLECTHDLRRYVMDSEFFAAYPETHDDIYWIRWPGWLNRVPFLRTVPKCGILVKDTSSFSLPLCHCEYPFLVVHRAKL